MQQPKPRKATVRGSEKWYVNIPVALSGKQSRRFFDKRADAEGFARSMASELHTQSEAFYSLSAHDKAILLRLLSRHSVEDIQRAMLRLKPRETRTVAAAALECQTAKTALGLRPRSVSSLKCTFKSFAGLYGELDICDIDARHVSDWISSSEWSAVTRRRYLTDISTLFKWCIRIGYAVSNPAATLDKPIVESQPPGILSVQECKDLLDRCLKKDKRLAPFIAVQLFGGLRPAEALRLESKDIRDNHIHVSAEKSKVRKRRLVTISDTLASWLKLKGDLPPANARKRMEAVRGEMKWPADCLRHSFCSYHLAKHQNAAQTALEAGHTEQVLFRHYRELVTKEQAEAFWKLTPFSPTHETTARR